MTWVLDTEPNTSPLRLGSWWPATAPPLKATGCCLCVQVMPHECAISSSLISFLLSSSQNLVVPQGARLLFWWVWRVGVGAEKALQLQCGEPLVQA